MTVYDIMLDEDREAVVMHIGTSDGELVTARGPSEARVLGDGLNAAADLIDGSGPSPSTVLVSVRMHRDEFDAMAGFMDSHNLDNMSEFVRSAIRWAINGGME